MMQQLLLVMLGAGLATIAFAVATLYARKRAARRREPGLRVMAAGAFLAIEAIEQGETSSAYASINGVGRWLHNEWQETAAIARHPMQNGATDKLLAKATSRYEVETRRILSA